MPSRPQSRPDARAILTQTREEGFAKLDTDLAFLLDCWHEVLTELGEKGFARLVPGHLPKRGQKALPPRGAQVISIAFQLLNLVEENAAQQAMRQRESALGLAAESGLWGRAFEKLSGQKIDAEVVKARLRSQVIEPVLTGHPTEAKRWTVLDQHRELYLLFVKLENQMFTKRERAAIREQIKTVLEELWRTGEILLTKPDLPSERRNTLYYLREKFPVILAQLDERLDAAWEDSLYGKTGSLGAEDRPQLCFGTWVGGDRDGHPLVTDRVTAETLAEMRAEALALLDEQLAHIEKRLGLSIYRHQPPATLQDRIKALRQELGAAGEQVVQPHSEEPWRQHIALLRVLLKQADARGLTPQDLQADLILLGEALEAVGAGRLRQREVQPVQRILATFGFHLARLDIRQNSAFHDRAIGQLLKLSGESDVAYANWPEEHRLAFLEKELGRMRPFAPPHADLPKEAEAVLACYRVLAEEIHAHGPAGLGSLIVSMTRDVSDLLGVYLLAREAGLLRKTPGGPVCLLPVVPLFETIDDLANSARIVEAFLAHPITQRSIAATALPGQRPRLQVMLGYSDSNKDSGIIASQWALHQAQKDLLAVGEEAGVDLVFFHGRGGTISRGAGPTHRFLESLPYGALRAGLRVTEQGETVAQKFTNHRTAAYHLELLLAGTGCTSLMPPRDAPEEVVEAVAYLAETSRAAYRHLLEDPGFIPFYRTATPIDALEQSRIGSRPSRRTGTASLDDLRAIPWVFSWTQARFFLPNWFGAGSGLAALESERPDLYEALTAHNSQWPLARYILVNLETGMASASEKWMRAYAQLVPDEKLRRGLLRRILSELRLTQRHLDNLLGQNLAERRPRFFKTLQLREAGLDLLHAEQIRLLQEWRAESKPKAADALLPDLLLSINAVASGLRTTG